MVRFDCDKLYSERFGVFRYAGRNGNTADITSGSYNNWSPRVGLAYAPHFWGGKTVIRGAFGGYRSPLVATGWYAAGARLTPAF